MIGTALRCPRHKGGKGERTPGWEAWLWVTSGVLGSWALVSVGSLLVGLVASQAIALPIGAVVSMLGRRDRRSRQ